MKKTFGEMYEFRVHASLYLKTLEEGETKLAYAIKKVDKKLQKHFDEYNEAMADVEIDHAATDENGILVTDEKGGFRFTPDSIKAKRKAYKKLADEWESKEFEVDTYFATEVPEDLNENFRNAFEGFVLESSVMETV
jgi:hypothetical protein